MVRGRRMTLRGRLTLVLLGGALVATAYAVARGEEELWGSGKAGSGGGLARVVTTEDALVPPEVLTRLPVAGEALDAARAGKATRASPGPRRRLVESVPIEPAPVGVVSPLRVEYTFDVELSRAVLRILRRNRVSMGHVLVLDPASGALLVYVSTDPEGFPATAPYPAASLVKIVTAAAALERSPETSRDLCRSVGSPYRLTRGRLDPPKRGRPVSLRRALATSNNQCFAQLSVHAVGAPALLAALDRFGFREMPGPGHAAGVIEDPKGDALALGRLGCGLAGSRITPLHAARLAASLADGKLVEPRWIAGVSDAEGRELLFPPRPPARRVLSRQAAKALRELLVDTTRRGTARRAFRGPRGRPLLQDIQVAGKTGSLTGRNPDGRFEWFAGVAPARDPRLAVAVLVVHGDLWWITSAQLAAEVFKVLFCPKGVCDPKAADRWLPTPRPLPLLAEARAP